MKKITAVKTMSGEMKLMFSLDSEKSESVPTARQQKPTRNRNPLTSFKNIIYSPLGFYWFTSCFYFSDIYSSFEVVLINGITYFKFYTFWVIQNSN